MTVNTPAAWNALRAKVQHATRHLTDAQLVERTAQLQQRCKRGSGAATWHVLQELYAEQHRRRWA